jgi:hypothetical protein
VATVGGDRARAAFAARQGRQLAAVALATLLVIVLAILSARPGLLGVHSRTVFSGLQVVVIAGFIGYTSQNWRCPVCRKHLGGDLYRQGCGKCGARFT